MKRTIVLFAFLTAVMTWPQVRYLSTEAAPHHDIYFNMWRLQWFAHALTTPSAKLFDTNIFYPERRTLALSDAILVESALAARLIWAGVAPVLVHNLVLLTAIVLSGAAMFLLARYLTGSRGAGILAGIIFAFAPYRFEHIMHMEMQWTMWMPLAFLALHRTFDTGRWRYGLATGLCIALQMLSCIYYGIFLATLIGLAAALLLVAHDRGVTFRRAALPLAGGAAVAAIVCGMYAQPYLLVHERVGDRPANEVSQFSARPNSYLAATPNNWLYGHYTGRSGGERRLFPGAVAVVLAITGVLLVPPSRRVIIYLLLLVAAFECSLGVNGYSYHLLEHLSVYRGLRALARLGVFVLMFIAVLAAYGYHWLFAGRSQLTRRIGVAAISVALLLEYRVKMSLTPYPNTAPPIYRVLAMLPRGTVAEVPFPQPNALPGNDAEYAYMSTFHWFPLVNGYSGVYPASYLQRLERMRHFPDDTSLRQLRADSVKYLVVHQGPYSHHELEIIERRLEGAGMVHVATFTDWEGDAIIYSTR